MQVHETLHKLPVIPIVVLWGKKCHQFTSERQSSKKSWKSCSWWLAGKDAHLRPHLITTWLFGVLNIPAPHAGPLEAEFLLQGSGSGGKHVNHLPGHACVHSGVHVHTLTHIRESQFIDQESLVQWSDYPPVIWKAGPPVLPLLAISPCESWPSSRAGSKNAAWSGESLAVSELLAPALCCLMVFPHFWWALKSAAKPFFSLTWGDTVQVQACCVPSPVKQTFSLVLDVATMAAGKCLAHDQLSALCPFLWQIPPQILGHCFIKESR